MSRVKQVPIREDVIQRARTQHAWALSAVKAYLGDVPFDYTPIDARAADRRLMQMTPDDVTAVTTDPIAAQHLIERMDALDARADLTETYSDEFEG